MRNKNFYSMVPAEKELYIINGYQHYYLDHHSKGYVDEKHHGTLNQFYSNLNKIRKYAGSRGSVVLFTEDKVDGNRQLIDKEIDRLSSKTEEETLLDLLTKDDVNEYAFDIEKGNIFSSPLMDKILKVVKPMQVFSGGMPFSSTVYNSANGVRLRGLSSYCITDLSVDYKDKKEKPAIELYVNSGIRFIKTKEILNI